MYIIREDHVSSTRASTYHCNRPTALRIFTGPQSITLRHVSAEAVAYCVCGFGSQTFETACAVEITQGPIIVCLLTVERPCERGDRTDELQCFV